jgi:hypothetical protein
MTIKIIIDDLKMANGEQIVPLCFWIHCQKLWNWARITTLTYYDFFIKVNYKWSTNILRWKILKTPFSGSKLEIKLFLSGNKR